jgi:hypothetical protein
MTLAWRSTVPLRKNMFEISSILAGTKSRGWWRARALGKTYHPSLGDLVHGRREAPQEAA